MRSSRKVKFERCKHFHSIEQSLISLDLKYFMIQIKSRYLKSILQSRSSLLPSYCTLPPATSLLSLSKFPKWSHFFVALLRDSSPRQVGLLVGWRFLAFQAYGSCPDTLVTFSSTAPAHPHATRVAVYPALLYSECCC